jgi:glycosyltransferase involved in cell wall biosynthesis
MSHKLPISVVFIAKNEAENLKRSLSAVAICGDIVVIDDHSTDNSREVAESLGARVLTHKFESFAAQRNYALEYADLKYDWVIMLDADEVATPEFLDEISRVINIASADTVAFKTCRKTIFMDHWLKYSDGFPVWIMRVVKKGHAQFENSGHGEVPVPKLKGQLGTIREPFLHYAFSKGINDWVVRHLKYAEREAQKELTETFPLRISEIISSDSSTRRKAIRNLARKLPGRPFLRFSYQYFFKWGFLDGPAGYTFCRMMATYEAMIQLKKWELKLKAEKEN